jgi:hypothetical protein
MCRQACPIPVLLITVPILAIYRDRRLTEMARWEKCPMSAKSASLPLTQSKMPFRDTQDGSPALMRYLNA